MTDGSVEQFIDWLAGRGRSGNTLAAYRRDLANYSEFLRRRGVDVATATGDDVAAFVDHLGALGRKPSSTARALVAVRALHRYRVEHAGATDDPARRITSAPVPAGETPALTVAEVLRLLDRTTGDQAIARRDRALLEVLYGAALRVSELVGLDRADVGARGLLTLRGDGGTRCVPSGGKAAEAVERWLAPGGRESFSRPGWAAAGDTEALFVNQHGRRLTRQGVWLIVRRRATEAGLSGDMTPQVLRHSCAVHLEAAGMAPDLVRLLLGAAPSDRGAARPPTAELVEAHRRFHPREQPGGER